MRRTRASVLALGTIVLLAACTGPGPLPEDGGPTPVASTTPSPQATDVPGADEPPASFEAVVTVASVDVDGAHVTASGYVGGLIEEGGTCRFTFTAPGAATTVEAPGHPDRATTTCGTVSVPREELARGSATVVLSYAAADGREVASEPVGLEIP